MTVEERIDPVDLKILDILLKDSRTNLNQIAKECNLSSSAILFRIKKLKEDGTIVSFGLQVKKGALGYPYEATVGVMAETSKNQSAAEEIRKNPNVIVCTKSIGKFNMCCLVIAKNMEDFDRATQRIKNVPGVKGIAINIILEQFIKNGEVTDQENDVNQEADRLDTAIIKELMADSRTPFIKIGKKLGISHETVKKKFETLKSKGIILCCSAIIDYSKLGYQGTVFIFISLTKGTEKTSTIEELRKFPSLYRINSVMGTFDIIAFANFKGLRDFTKLIDDIQQIHSIGQIDFCLANYTYFSFIPIPLTPIKCDTIELS